MSDDQMWKPPDGAKMVTVGQMFDLAKRFRSKAYWWRDGYYTTDAEAASNHAVRETFEGIAQELDELFGFDSQLTSNETRTR
jgi:hypothetical protein